MADKKSDDEYEYDPLDMGPEGSTDVYSEEETSPTLEEERRPGSPVIRNSLILLASIAILIIGYHFISGILAKKTVSQVKVVQKTTTTKPKVTPTPEPIIVKQEPLIQSTEALDTNRKKMEEQLQLLENNQQNLQGQVSSMNDKLQSVSSTMAALTKQIENLNQTVLTLSDKMSADSEKLAALAVCTKKPQIIAVRKVKRISVPRVLYYLQAIIPGRAWLIGTNGSTLTIREGSIVPGFGVVKLIDAMQGRVLMQSGQVIEFSQQDS